MKVKQEFTSVVQLLKNTGIEYVEIKDWNVSDELFDARAIVTWFYKLNIVLNNNNNDCIQLKMLNGKWVKRKNRSNGWYAISIGEGKFYEAMKKAQIDVVSNLIEQE